MHGRTNQTGPISAHHSLILTVRSIGNNLYTPMISSSVMLGIRHPSAVRRRTPLLVDPTSKRLCILSAPSAPLQSLQIKKKLTHHRDCTPRPRSAVPSTRLPLHPASRWPSSPPPLLPHRRGVLPHAHTVVAASPHEVTPTRLLVSTPPGAPHAPLSPGGSAAAHQETRSRPPAVILLHRDR
jgi:hypothetical protein